MVALNLGPQVPDGRAAALAYCTAHVLARCLDAVHAQPPSERGCAEWHANAVPDRRQHWAILNLAPWSVQSPVTRRCTGWRWHTLRRALRPNTGCVTSAATPRVQPPPRPALRRNCHWSMGDGRHWAISLPSADWPGCAVHTSLLLQSRKVALVVCGVRRGWPSPRPRQYRYRS